MDFLKEAENKFHKVIDQTADAATDKIGSVIGVEKDKMKDEDTVKHYRSYKTKGASGLLRAGYCSAIRVVTDEQEEGLTNEGIAGVLNEVKKAVPDAESAVSRFISFWKKLFR